MNINKKIKEKLDAQKEYKMNFNKIFYDIAFFCEHAYYGKNYNYFINGDYKFTILYYNEFILSARNTCDGNVEILEGKEPPCTYQLKDAENVIEKILSDHYCKVNQ